MASRRINYDITPETGDSNSSIPHSHHEPVRKHVSDFLIDRSKRPFNKRRSNRGLSALQVAVKENDVEECIKQIQAGWPIEATDDNDNSLLAVASQSGHAGVVEVLIKHNADINSRNIHGDTPLTLCVECGHVHVAELLVGAGCDLSIGGVQGRTALHTAVIRGGHDIISLLLQPGCDVNAHDAQLYTPLIHAVMMRDDHSLCQLIGPHGCLLDKGDKHGQTALYHAAMGGYLEGVTQLINGGCNVDIPKTCHDTPLIASIKMGHFTVAMALTAAGCDVNKPGHRGITAIHAALKNMHETCGAMMNYGLIPNNEGVDLIRALVEAGCCVDTRDSEGFTSLYLATKLALFEMTRLLINKGCCINARTNSGDSVLHGAVMGKHPAIVQLVIVSGVDINPVNQNNEHPLYTAVSCWADLKVIEHIVKAGADLDTQETTGLCSALHRAIIQNRTDVALFLIESGCDIRLENGNREDAIYLCCFYGNQTVLTRLTGHPHFTTVTDKLSRIPTHAGVSKNHVGVVEIMERAGADMNRVDSNGRSVIQIACEEDNLSAVERLLSLGADPAAHTTVVFRRCCIHAPDRHPHFDQEPLFIAMKYRNVAMLGALLGAYYITPRRVIKTLATILRGTPEIHTHYPSDMRREIVQLFHGHLCRVRSLQQMCVGAVRLRLGEGAHTKVTELRLPVGLVDLVRRKRLLS